MAQGRQTTSSRRGSLMNNRRRQLLLTIDDIARSRGFGANYQDLGASLRLSVTYVRTLMMEHHRAGFAEPIAGEPRRGWRLTDAGKDQLKVR